MKLPVLGVPEGKYLQQASHEGLAAFEKQLKHLEQAGYTVKHIPMFDQIEELNARHRRLMSAEAAQEHAAWFKSYRALYRPRTEEVILNGQQVSPEALEAAQHSQYALREYLADQQASHGIDVWISPPARGEAPEGIHATGDPIMNFPWTHAGVPTITLPAGMSKNTLPLGLQCAAGFLQDEKLLLWSRRLSDVLKTATKR
jgi:Asp-tRNA(Asn)/Glu-tRNA(Gln) amidotransferase A subunit family amidase